MSDISEIAVFGPNTDRCDTEAFAEMLLGGNVK
jgi:hypothetical protein